MIQRAALLALRKGGEVRQMEAWLVGVVWRYCMAVARRRARSLPEWPAVALPASPPPDERCRVSVDVDRLRSVLPEKDWKLLWWIFGEGLSWREIAERRGCSVHSVGMMKRRALSKARGLLESGDSTPGRPAPKLPRRPGRRAARNHALGMLHRGGVTVSELAGLNFEDVRLDRSELAIRRVEGAEVIRLPGLTLDALRAWCELRGGAPGPLFPSFKVKGKRLTPEGVGLILSRLPSGEASPQEALRPPVAVLRAARDKALARLHEEGLGPYRLCRVRVEDVGEEALSIDGVRVGLSDSSMAAVRAWLALLNQGSGFLFVKLTGSRPALTGARIWQILARPGCSSAWTGKAELPLR